MTILFLNLQITRSNVRPHTKWAVSLMIVYGHFTTPRGRFQVKVTNYFNTCETFLTGGALPKLSTVLGTMTPGSDEVTAGTGDGPGLGLL